MLDFLFDFQIKYLDHYGQALMAEHLEELKVISPFQVAHRIANLHNAALDSVFINEDFTLSCTIKNTSNTKLRITNVSFGADVSDSINYL